MQEILVYIALFISVAFLVKRFFWKPKSNKAKNANCGKEDCGCA